MRIGTGMRVTNKMMIDTSLRDMGVNSGKMAKLQEQMGSQKRINRLSDDPLGLITSLRARSRMYIMESHVSNLDDADTWLTATETNLMEINKLITTIYEDSINASTDVKNGMDRDAIAQKVRELRDQLLQTGNNTQADKYIFGGYNATRAPFTLENGILYYNGYNMYSSTTRSLNIETAIADMFGALETAAADSITNGSTTAQEVRDDVEAARSAAEQILEAALQVSSTRGFPDGKGGTRPPTEQDMLDAANDALAYFSVKNGWTAEQSATAQQAIDSLQNAYNDGADIDKLETMAETMSSAMRATVDELTTKLRTNPPITTAADARNFLTDAALHADAVANMAVEAAGSATTGKGIEFEGDRKYEIEVGLGQYMNVTMNGVEVFGTGEKNIYKILDDLYNALIKEYNDSSYSTEAYANKVVSSIDTYVQNAVPAINVGNIVGAIDGYLQSLSDPPDSLAAAQADMTEVDLILSQMADAGIAADNTADALTAMNTIAGTAVSPAAQAAAAAMLLEVTNASTATPPKTKTQIDAGLTEAKAAVNATVAAVNAPTATTIASMQALSGDQLALYTGTPVVNTGAMVDTIDSYVRGLTDPPATLAASQAIVTEIDSILSQMADAGIAAGNAADALTAMNTIAGTAVSPEAQAAAAAMIAEVTNASTGGATKAQIDAGLGVAKAAVNAAAAAVTDPAVATIADMQTVSGDQLAAYSGTPAIDTGNIMTPIDSYLQSLSDPPDTLATAQATMTEIDSILSQMADAGVAAGNAADALTAMNAIAGTAVSPAAQAAAAAMIAEVTTASTAMPPRTKVEIDAGLRVAKAAVHAATAAVNAPSTTTIADMQTISGSQLATYSGAPVTAADIDATVNEIAAAISAVVDAGLTTTGSSPAVVIERMSAAMSDTWSQAAKDAANALIQQVEYAQNGGMSMEDIFTGLRAAKDGADTAAAAITSQGSIAAKQAEADAQKVDFDAQERFSHGGKKTGSTADDITPFISKLQGAQKDTMAQLAVIGGRTNRVAIVRERYALDEINYTDRISKVEDADLTEVIMRLKMAESVYNASLSSGARIIQSTLMDFLR